MVYATIIPPIVLSVTATIFLLSIIVSIAAAVLLQSCTAILPVVLWLLCCTGSAIRPSLEVLVTARATARSARVVCELTCNY